MSRDYKSVSTSELDRRWARLRKRVIAGKGKAKDMDELNALRREIDRRRGERNPTVEVNFEDYVKD